MAQQQPGGHVEDAGGAFGPVAGVTESFHAMHRMTECHIRSIFTEGEKAEEAAYQEAARPMAEALGHEAEVESRRQLPEAGLRAGSAALPAEARGPVSAGPPRPGPSPVAGPPGPG
ncbi:hypothetical protein GCM10010149_14020 [Nonomuraea roseoviolacea subsp. roseoviolacea]